MEIDGKLREVIGVLPASFRFLTQRAELLLPFQFDRNKLRLGNFSYSAVARLKPGVTVAQANADAARMLPIVNAKFPAPPGYSVKVFENARIAPAIRPLKQDVIGDVGSVLWVLMGTIGMVLAIACANVANLLLVRAEGRQHELAIRTALGAGRWQIAGEILFESLVLGVGGGVLGLGLAYGALRLLVAMGPAGLPRLEEIAIDPWVLVFTLVVSLFSGALFGLIPVLKYAGPSTMGALRQGGRTLGASRQRHRARNALVVAQVALALVLLVCSGLMIRTFRALRHVEPGFLHPEQVETLRIFIPAALVKDDVAMVSDAKRISCAGWPRFRAFPPPALPPPSPWMETAVSIRSSPKTGILRRASSRRFAASSSPRQAFCTPSAIRSWRAAISPGPTFTTKPPSPSSPKTSPANGGTIRAPALGKRIRGNLNEPWREIVGVTGNERDDGLQSPAPTTVYWPVMMDHFWGNDTFVSRRSGIRHTQQPHRLARAFSTKFARRFGPPMPACRCQRAHAR